MPPVTLPLIYIPTWGRTRIRTVEQMSPAVRYRVRLAVTPNWGKELTAAGVTERQVPFGADTGAADAKQRIMDRDTSPVVVILDDDLVFQTAVWECGKKRFRKSTPEQVTTILTLLTQKAAERNVGFTSLSSPAFNTGQDEWAVCKFPCASFVINRRTAAETGAKFGGILTREDAQFALMTWTKGRPSYSLMSHAIINGGDSSIGGESLIREDGTELPGRIKRGDRTETAHKQLAELFPRYVKLVRNKNARTTEVGCTLDIRVFGVRAYRDAVRRAGPP